MQRERTSDAKGRHPNDINVGMFRTGEVEKLDLAIAKAKQKGVLKAIVVALEDKIKYLVILSPILAQVRLKQ